MAHEWKRLPADQDEPRASLKEPVRLQVVRDTHFGPQFQSSSGDGSQPSDATSERGGSDAASVVPAVSQMLRRALAWVSPTWTRPSQATAVIRRGRWVRDPGIDQSNGHQHRPKRRP